MDCYVFDLEGTLTDIGHRIHHAKRALEYKRNEQHALSDRQWTFWDVGFVKDPPQPAMVAMAQRLYPYAPVHILTGRQECYREETTHRLMDLSVPFSKMLMRATGNYDEPNAKVKGRMVDELQAQGWNIVMAFDDMTEVVKMYRARKIPCCHVEGYEGQHR